MSRVARIAWISAWAGLTILACRGDDAAGPSFGSAVLAVQPQFAGGSLAAQGLAVDRVRLRAVRRPAEVALDQVVPWSLDSVSLRLRGSIVLRAPAETLQVTLELMAGTQVLFSGTSLVEVRDALRNPPTPTPIGLAYVGPGANVASLTISPRDTSLSLGDSLRLTVNALDSAGSTITALYVAWSSSNPQLGTISAAGVVRAGSLRGSVSIVARSATGVADTTTVSLVPVVSQLLRIAGDGQTGLLGALLSAPLVVEARAADGLPIAGVTVRFRALTGGGTAIDSVVVTDGAGRAAARVLLGLIAGSQTFEARVGAVTTTFSATAAAGAADVLFSGDSAGGLNSGIFRAGTVAPGAVRITPEGATGDVNPRYAPGLSRITYTANPGTGANQLHVATLAGDTIAHLTSPTDTSLRRPRFSPDGRHLAAECGDGFSFGQDVCVVANVTGAVGALNNLGPGVFVTDIRRTLGGPGSFAWDPRTADRLAVVRDSLSGQFPASRIYTVAFDGSAPVQLTADVMDLGAGPLRIVSTMEWNAATDLLVFVAQDPSGAQHLYTSNRAGTIRQITAAATAADYQPVFAPDGSEIVFIRVDQLAQAEYYRIRPDGTGETRMTAENLVDINVQRLGADWSPNGSEVVLIGTSPVGDQAVYVVPRGVTAATYLATRRLIGRQSVGSPSIFDQQPSWRP